MKTFFRDLLWLFSELLSLGGRQRLDDAKTAYEMSYRDYESAHAQLDDWQSKIHDAIVAIGDSVRRANRLLQRAGKVIARSVQLHEAVQSECGTETLSRMQRFNSGISGAIGFSAGSISGGSLAVGSWALVSALGSASTGAAISGLSGIAATNATLAWFGGGALAVGGAGISGGMTVLGGIFAIPLIFFYAKGIHGKAKKFEDERIRVGNALVEVNERLALMPERFALLKKREREISKICQDFESAVPPLMKVLRPQGWLSALKQEILAMLGRQPVTDIQQDALRSLNLHVAEFLRAFG